MNVLVVGSGGREHALADSIVKSKKVDKVFCAPGNAGTAKIAVNVDIAVSDIDKLAGFALENSIDFTVVGPEAPLVAGIADVFREKGLKIFGPGKDGAMLEASKSFTKSILSENNIPTAAYAEFTESGPAKEYISALKNYPVVIKADGLAAGKGVVICETESEAVNAVTDIMDEKIFKSAGDRIVIEEFLEGEEVSILAFTDGEAILTLPASRDHKRAYDNDKGPNTGGMGAYAPAPLVDNKMEEEIKNKILKPTMEGLKKKGIEYKGILYAGLMITKDGPKVLEYNVRFGDPETQAVLSLLKSDIVELFEACVDSTLSQKKTEIHDKSAVCVVLASGGYPGAYEKGKEIRGLDKFENREKIKVYHAGTAEKDGKTVTSGGRVLGIVAEGEGLDSAIKNVYKEIDKIEFDGVCYRKDIGKTV